MKHGKIFIILISIILVGAAGFVYYRSAIFSKQILRLEILGPDTAKMADEIEYTVKYKNNGNFTLENPKLTFELPDNSLTEDGKTLITQNLKDIYPGEEEFVTFKARLAGKEGDLKVARASISYTPHNLSARYESDTTFTTKISSVPINLTYDLPSRAEKGKEINYSINYFSNIDYPLENLSLKINPVQGFDFKSADPSSLDNQEWKIGSLNKSQGGRVNVDGIISADPSSKLTFSAELGIWQDGNFIVIKEISQDVLVVQPLIFISQQINGSPDYVASPGDTLNYRIILRNIGSSPFDNLFLVSKLSGSAFDFSTLKSDHGQAKPGDNLIIFDPDQVSSLLHVASQQEVALNFSIKLKNSSSSAGQVVKNEVDVSGISQEFDTKVNSKLELSQKAYYSAFDSMENTGPVPPKVGQATTYIINWRVKNYSNDMKNAKVKAVLPQNVSLYDNIFPEDQASNFTFDSKSREIVWLLGDLPSSATRSLSFQVSLTPTEDQKGQSADIVLQAMVFGDDQFTGSTVQSEAQSVNTTLPDDQTAGGGGIVQ